MNMTLLKVKQGHFETAILILHNLLFFYHGCRCLEGLHLNIFVIETLSTVMQLFKGSYFSQGAASRHLWPNSAIPNGTMHALYALLSHQTLWVLNSSYFPQVGLCEAPGLDVPVKLWTCVRNSQSSHFCPCLLYPHYPKFRPPKWRVLH